MMGRQEKSSSFSVTCNLLSQYLKEKRTFGDFIAPLAPKESFKPPVTMSLLPGVVVEEEEEEVETKEEEISEQNATKAMDLFPKLSSSQDPVANKSSLENSPLTIIYNGKVLVFDNIPAAKAKDLLQMANKGSIGTQTNIPATSAVQNTPNPSGVPIARRASLHRFLEKRKERINSNAPYQVKDDEIFASKSKLKDGGNSWLGLGSIKTEKSFN
ncbi:Tify domain-containing protein [Dioscorea alata]|uniref:Tify domain-containing protein n=1 Tax=Dioscorea alata TaxID=55571 RepID=A0ACB7U4Y0_DIOAL|nr:Tify domain-containing protein [Dioscorea alata]